MRKNPCELQVDLFCRGMRIDPSCLEAGDLPSLARARAGLGSGVDLVIPGGPPLHRDVWVNVPVGESFVEATPYLLRCGGGIELLDRRDGEVYPVRLPAEPAWYRRRTGSGVEMRRVGVLQGTYLGVYVGDPCHFWRGEGTLRCRFCTTGLNVDPDRVTTVDEVVETARVAKEESGVTFVHLNTGYQGGEALRVMVPFVTALKERVGVLVGVQVVPEGPLSELDRLRELGCDHFSFCYEYHNPGYFRCLCPGKEAVVGQQAFFEALEHCQARMPRGSCSGEIIAGNEPVEDTLAAIDWITGIGAFPTVCIFRPLVGSYMSHWPVPSYETMRAVMKHLWRRCRERAVPIGLAPNIEVSLIVQPTDAAYLADGSWRDRWYLFRLGLLRRLAAPAFRRRMARTG
ncbi:MAG: radical SAM protein [Planctomycetota bacterium]